MITISLCMIVKNEENTLGNCLESVKGIVDEIIIVDTGSTDNTKEVALQYGAQIFDFEWINDFSAARNFSFSKASCDYIMWLDADDKIDEENRKLILQAKPTITNDIDVVFIKYGTHIDEKGIPVFNCYRERIIKKSCNFKWVEPVHEYIPTNYNRAYWDITIVHTKSHDTNSDRNLKMYQEIVSQGKKLSPRGMYYYARELRSHKYVKEATECFEQFLANKDGWMEDCISTCLILAQIYEMNGEYSKAYDILFDSFYYDLPRADICCRLGELYRNNKDYQRAIYWYKIALTPESQNSLGIFEPACYDFIPFLCLSSLYDDTGKFELALEYHEKAKKLNPNHPSIIHNEKYFQKKINNML